MHCGQQAMLTQEHCAAWRQTARRPDRFAETQQTFDRPRRGGTLAEGTLVVALE